MAFGNSAVGDRVVSRDGHAQSARLRAPTPLYVPPDTAHARARPGLPAAEAPRGSAGSSLRAVATPLVHGLEPVRFARHAPARVLLLGSLTQWKASLNVFWRWSQKGASVLAAEQLPSWPHRRVRQWAARD